MVDKLAALKAAARALNGAGVTWVLGGSAMLYLHGITDSFRDIDLMIAEEDIQKALQALAPLGKMLDSEPDASYLTRHFYQMEIEGLSLDLMAGLTLKADGETHYLPLKRQEITEYKELEGVMIPLHSLSAWRRIYALLKRPQRVKVIQDYLNQRPG